MVRLRQTDPGPAGVFAGLVQASARRPEPDSLEWIARVAAPGQGPSGTGRTTAASSPAPIAGERATGLLELALHATESFPPEVFRWLQDALQSYAAEGHAGTLERHLGLKVEQHKGRSAVRRRLVERRWRALGEAYGAQVDCNDLAPSRRCAILLADLEDFGQRFWPEWHKGGPPTDKSSSRLRLALFDVFVAYDGAPPRNANSIGRALEQAGIIVHGSSSRE